MDQKLKGCVKSAENKRMLENNPRDNRGLQLVFNRQNVVGNNERKRYVGSLPYCNKCMLHHEGPCTVRCGNCKRVGHQTRDLQLLLQTLREPLLGISRTGNKTRSNEATAKAYAIKGGANPDSNVVTGTFLLNICYASMVFDLRADRSFVSSTFSALLDVAPSTLDTSHPFDIDLMPVELGSFNVIIGMDWMAKNDAVIVYDEKVIHIPYGDEVLINQSDNIDSRIKSKLNIISCTRNQKYIEKGCQVYLAQVMSKKEEDKSEESGDPPQISFISNLDFDNNFPQTSQILCCENCGGPHETFQYPIIHHPPQETSVEILQARENLMKSIQTFLKKFNHISFRETPKVLSLAWEKFFEIQHAFREKQHQPEDIHKLLRKLLEDFQIISEELEEYINSPSWNYPTFYDDDDEYSIQHREYLENSSNGSDEVIKSSVENLVPIPSESEGIFDDTCDVPFSDNSPPLDVLNDHFELLSVFNDDCTSSDDDSFEDINYVEASPLDSELISLEEVKDDILHETLLNINLLIAKIKSLNDNPTPDCVLKSPSPFLIPVKDSNYFFKKSDTCLSYSDNSLPEFETFSDHTKETSSGSTITHADNSLPEYDSFLFEIEPD
uniref:Reverse transcriptase domain-containing protein n=1 Tax=Tanacetum cinerariifolium TaxID=118510 RepID=A0A699HYH7_TANCI|nr:hypothetical protein [Tanacetum cinerariifolium]